MNKTEKEVIHMQSFYFNNPDHLELFKEIDTNDDGYITLKELRNFFLRNRDKYPHIRKRKIAKLMKMADTNNDKLIDNKEFEDLLESFDLEYWIHKGISTYVHHLVPVQEKPTVRRLNNFQARSLPVGGAREVEENEPNLCSEFSCRPPPVFMFLISILELVLFLTDELTEKDSTLTVSGVTGRYLQYDPDKEKEIWRFLTYMFVHIGWMHLIMNLIVQLFLGIPLEAIHRWWRVLLIYFLGGIAGCLAHAVVDGYLRLGGASGGVYALLTAHIASVIMNWKNLPFAWVQMFIFTILISADLGVASYNRYYMGIHTEVGVTCHVGGAIAGLLVGIYVVRNVEETSAERYIWWAALTIYIVLTIVFIVLIVFK